jgi:hypothetical protein
VAQATFVLSQSNSAARLPSIQHKVTLDINMSTIKYDRAHKKGLAAPPSRDRLPDPSKKRQPVFSGAGGVRVGFTGSRAQSATPRRGW